MAKLTSVTYVGPFDRVSVPSLGIDVEQGQTIQVGADAAGRPPGPWRPRTPEDPDHWPRRPGTTDDGAAVTETHDPGEGLLAQHDNWQPTAAAPVPSES